MITFSTKCLQVPDFKIWSGYSSVTVENRTFSTSNVSTDVIDIDLPDTHMRSDSMLNSVVNVEMCLQLVTVFVKLQVLILEVLD